MLVFVRTVFLSAFLFTLFCGMQGIPDAPSPYQMVNDYYGLLSKPQQSKLEEKLRAFDDSTTNQIVIVIEKSLHGYSLESYSTGLFNKWGIGQKVKNNGILIIVVPDERKTRIELGQGLEKAVPNQGSDIIQQVMLPAFRNKDYYTGLLHGCDSLMKYAAIAFHK